jgi:ATP-binding cassette subfamily F protein 3
MIVDGLGVRIGESDRIGLIGPNGSGKTTLLRIIAGEQSIDRGLVQRSKGVRIGYLPQDIEVEGGRTLRDMVLSSVPGRTELDVRLAAAESELDSNADKLSDDEMMSLASEVAELHETLDHFERFFSEHTALRILAGLGFEPKDPDRDVSEFSGGWKMRGVLSALLFQQPDLMLLDEPTNHLDLPSVAWFSDFLRKWKRAFIMISHDREFLNEQISRVISFEPEGVRQFSGNYERYVKHRVEEEIVLENKAKNLAREREHMQRFVDRFRAQANKAKAVQSRVKALAKMEDVELFQRRRTMRFSFPPVARAVGDVVRVENVTKAFGDLVVLDGINLNVHRGEKIGIIGPNGAGKTTLLKMIAGELEASSGKITIGNKVDLGYYAQHHADTLHPDLTAYDEVAHANPDASPNRVRSILGAFLFSGDDVEKKVSVLSGGERARVALARLLIKPGNLLLMDEPTNHLDLESSESLAAALSKYDGSLIFVSHNRSLIRQLATRIWNVEDGGIETYAGTLDEYMHSVRLRLEAEHNTGDGEIAPVDKTPHKASSEPEQADHKLSRDDAKQRKRREAEERKRRAKVIGPIEKKVARLEERITKLEEAQKERSSELSDPEVYDDAKRRNELLNAFQVAGDKLDELNSRWERAVEELDEATTALGTSPNGE